MRAIEVAGQNVGDVGDHLTAHGLGRGFDPRVGGGALIGACLGKLQAVQHRLAGLGARFQHEVTVARHLGHGDVVAGFGAGSGAHGGTETGATGAAAIDRDDQRRITSRAVSGVGEGAVVEDLVEDPDRRKVAGANTQENPRGGYFGPGVDGKAAVATAGGEQFLLGRIEITLPGEGPRHMVEIGAVRAFRQAVAPGALLINDTLGQFAGAGNRGVNDGAVAHRRADDLVIPGPERVQEIC